MTVHQLWEQGINALPKGLKEEFGKPRMILNADRTPVSLFCDSGIRPLNTV